MMPDYQIPPCTMYDIEGTGKHKELCPKVCILKEKHTIRHECTCGATWEMELPE